MISGVTRAFPIKTPVAVAASAAIVPTVRAPFNTAPPHVLITDAALVIPFVTFLQPDLAAGGAAGGASGIDCLPL